MYKLEHGISNSSHGVWVAEIAGLPSQVVERAEEISEQFKLKIEKVKMR